jgi:hypothetical protein
MALTHDLRGLLFGNPFGETFPPKQNPPLQSVDGRTIALRILGRYISEITFYRPMRPGQAPEAFWVPEKNFYPDWPDNVQDVVFPACAVIPARVDYDVIGLVSYVEESTRDRYAKGTVLQWMSEYTEKINLEFWTSTIPERRAIAAGFEAMMSPTEQMSGLRFRMPDYFDELVCFTLNSRTNIDDEMAGKRRRKIRFEIEMRFNVVALVNYVSFEPQATVDVDVDLDTGLPVVIGGDDDPNAEITPDGQ